MASTKVKKSKTQRKSNKKKTNVKVTAAESSEFYPYNNRNRTIDIEYECGVFP